MQSIRGVTVDRHFPGKYSGTRFAGTGRQELWPPNISWFPWICSGAVDPILSLPPRPPNSQQIQFDRNTATSTRPPYDRTMCVHCVWGSPPLPLRFAYTRISRAASRRSARSKGENIGTRERRKRGGDIERERESGSQQTMLLLDKVLFSVVVFACNQPHPPPPGLHYLLVLFVVVSCNLHVP